MVTGRVFWGAWRWGEQLLARMKETLRPQDKEALPQRFGGVPRDGWRAQWVVLATVHVAGLLQGCEMRGGSDYLCGPLQT